MGLSKKQLEEEITFFVNIYKDKKVSEIKDKIVEFITRCTSKKVPVPICVRDIEGNILAIRDWFYNSFIIVKNDATDKLNLNGVEFGKKSNKLGYSTMCKYSTNLWTKLYTTSKKLKQQILEGAAQGKDMTQVSAELKKITSAPKDITAAGIKPYFNDIESCKQYLINKGARL